MIINLSQHHMLNDMREVYNEVYFTSDPITYPKADKIHWYTTPSNVPCTVAGFLESSYNKFPKSSDQVIMEFEPFTDYYSNYLQSPLDTNPGFISFLRGQLPGQRPANEPYSAMVWSYADMFMVTLPDRYTVY